MTSRFLNPTGSTGSSLRTMSLKYSASRPAMPFRFCSAVTHAASSLLATARPETPPVARRQGLLDGLIHEYHAVAA